MAENTEIMEESAELATTDNRGMQVTTFAENLMRDVSEQGYWASFEVSTMEEKKVLFAARNDNELLRDHMGEVIPLVGIVLDTRSINDIQYGIRNVPCVHLIAEDGKVYQSTSQGVVEKACEIISSFGMPDTWGGAIEVVCKETTTNAGFRYKYLSVC